MQNDLEYKLYKEELNLAPLSKRALAFTVDKILLSLILLAAMGDKFSGKSLEAIVAAVNQAFMFTAVLDIAYQTIFTKLYGATVGKMIFKIRVVDVDILDNPSWRASVLRASMRFLGEALFYLGLVWALFDPFRQGWHDKLAKTMVLDASA